MVTSFKLAWALLLIIPWVQAGVLPNSASCARECREPLNPKFRYVIGQTYTHNFQASSKTWMMGTSEDRAVLGVKGQALVTFRAPCEAVLQLRQTSISGVDEKVDASELEKRPLIFSWQDGTIDTLCSETSDPAWVVNIKRSVLSMMQHSAQFSDVSEAHVIESDVIGRCPTKYSVEATGQSVKVTKTKIPNQCSERIGRNSSIPAVQYSVPAETQTIPLLNSTSVCRQHIKDGIVQSTECEETHLFRPLSAGQGGASAEVTSSIKLVSSTNTGAAAKLSPSGELETSTLILDPLGVQAEIQSPKDVNAVVRAVCSQLASDSPARVSRLFTELVHALRRASPSDVKAAYNNMMTKKVCPESAKTEKLFLDALPQAGSTGAIVLMAELLKENKVSERQALGWYLSLPLSKLVGSEAIKAILPLVEKASDSPVALLGLTGLARRYCLQNPSECQSSSDVQQLSRNLGKLLGNKCQVDAKDEIRVIAALKALGNMGVMVPEVRLTVNQCVKDDRLPAPIRLAAIEATRNNPCEKDVKDNLLSILDNKREENEIRIAAYQGVMRCPCTKAMLRVQQALNSEDSNQVGSYIKSHLENLKKNNSPGKRNIRRLIEKVGLDRSFPTDLRKYSRNLAAASFCPVNNVGWDIDTSLVYAAKSFIPRSASMNLTLDLFGQSVNLFEFGIRTENLETILESFLGPNAVDKEGVAGLLEKAGDSIGQFGGNIWDRLSSISRTKRATIKSNELSNFDKLINLKDKNSGIKLDAFLRIFGSEVGMINYRGANGQKPEILSGLESKIADAWRDLIMGAKQVNIDVARSLMFLDSSATFPTVAGFPLRLAINGTTTVGLGLESQTDIPALLRNPLNSNVQFKISPLAVTELSASMTVDIAVVRTGVKMVATVHSSMAADFSARLQQGSAVEVKLDLPKSKITLVDLKSEVMLIQQSVDKDERRKPLNIINKATYERGGCSENWSAITGLRFCASSKMTIPRPAADQSEDQTPAFPFSGMGSFAIAIEKTEPSMRGYLVSATVKQEGPKASSFVMTLDTPGSKTNRKVSVKGTMTSSPLALKVDSKAPWGNMNLEAELVDGQDQKSAMVKLVTQDKREFYGKWQSQRTISRSENKYSYTTSVEAAWPGQPRAVILEGKFGHIIGSSIEISLKPAGPYASWPLSFQGTVSREFTSTVQKVSLSDVQLITPLGKTILSSEIGRQDRGFLSSFNMKYGTDQKLHSVAFNAKVQSQPTQSQDDISYKTVVAYKSSRFPRMNVDLKWDLQRSPSLLSNTLTLVHGQDSEQSTNRLYINQYSVVSGAIVKKDYVVDNKLEVTYPRYGMNFKLEQNFKLDQRALKGSFVVMNENIRIVESDLNVVFVPKDSRNFYELSAKLSYPGRTVTLTDTGKKIDANSFSISPVLEFQPGNKIELNGKASYIRDQSGLSINLDSEIRSRGLNSPIKLIHSFQRTDDRTMTLNNRVEWDGKAQIVLNARTFLRTPVMPAADVMFMWNGHADGKFDTRISTDESKMDLNLNLVRLQRRIKVSSQHKIFGTNRSGSINVAWDADKDPSKQIGLEGSLVLSMPQRSAELKSTLSVLNRNYVGSVSSKWGSDYLNGDHSLRAELQLPSSKNTYINLALSNSYQARKIANRVDVETQLLNANLYQVSLSNVISDLDRSATTFNAITELTFKGTNLDDMKWRLETKRSVRGDKHNVDLKSLIIAPKWGQNIDTSANVEVSNGMYRASSKYQRGAMLITLESTGKVVRQGSKINVDGFVELKAPKTWLQQSKIAVVSSYDIISLTNFDVSEKLSIVYQNTKTITVDTIAKLSPSNADFSLIIATPYQAARRQGVTVSSRYDSSIPRAEGSLVFLWSSPSQRQSQEVRLDVEVERRPGQQLRVKLTGSSPMPSLESVELSFDGRRMEDGRVWELDLITGVSDKKAKLTGRLNLNRAQRELDLSLTVDNSNPLRFLGRFGVQPDAYNVETRIDWGSGTLTVDGTVKYIEASVSEVRVMVNSPELRINSLELKFSRTMKKSKTRSSDSTINSGSMELMVLRESAPVVTIKSTYDRKDTKTGLEITGTAQVSVAEPELSGSVKYLVERRKVETGSENGIEYKLTVDVTSGQLQLEKLGGKLKLTNKEKSGSLGACGILNACREVSFAYKDAENAAGKVFYVLHKVEDDGTSKVSGIRVKHIVSPKKLDHSVEILLDEANKRLVGYKAFVDDNELGIEVYTPQRVSRASLEITRPTGRLAGKSQYILSVWLDKMNAPERKLVVASTAEVHRLGDMDGYSISTVVKHPLLPRDLEYKLEFHAATRGQKAVHMKLDLDSMDSKHKRWILEGRVENTLGEGRTGNFKLESELRSKGTDLAAQLSLHLEATEQSRSMAANLKLKEKERVVKDLFVRLNATRQSASIALGSPAKQLTLDGRWSVDEVLSYSRIQLSSASRIFGLSPSVVVLDLNTSPHVDLRVFNKASSENYYQVSGGLLDDTRFELALAHQLNVQRKELAALQVHLNSSSLLTTRMTWKVEDLRTLLTAVRSRTQSVTKELTDIASSLTSDLRPLLAKWRPSDNMEASYKKVAVDFVKQLKEMKAEAEKDDSLRVVAALIDEIGDFAEQAVEAIGDLSDKWQSDNDLIDRISDVFSAAAQRLSSLISRLGAALDNLYTTLNPWAGDQSIMDALRIRYQKAREIILQLSEKIRARTNRLMDLMDSYIRDNRVIIAIKDAISNANAEAILRRVTVFLDETVLLPVEDSMNQLVKDYPEMTRVVYRYVQRPIRKIRETLDLIASRLSSHQKTISQANPKQLLKSLVGEVVVYDIKNGEIHYELPMNEDMNSLRDLYKTIRQRTSALNQLAASSTLRSKIHEIRSKYDPTKMSTHLRGYASLIGSNGIITFDQKSYEVTGNCQYLLARDFLNQDFAVAVNYEENTGKKSVILTDGADQVEIKGEQVLVNSKQPASMPVTLKTIAVQRIGDVVIVKRSSGVVLRCDVAKDVCTLELSPFYAGRTMGLWGTFSSEHADDMTEPSGKTSKDLTTFINSWKLNRSCRDQRAVAQAARAVPNQYALDSCQSLFENTSSELSSCFWTVSPAPYHELCLKMAAGKAPNTVSVNAIKSIVAGYTAACHRSGISL